MLVDLAVAAEAGGWDGVFLWDHVVYRPPIRAVADPWVALSVIAAHTDRVRLGPTVTPLLRACGVRRPLSRRLLSESAGSSVREGSAGRLHRSDSGL